MSQIMDMDVLKDIPGYKAILKSVVKTQIQLLIEQLADHTGEESIILTASVNDGTLSHLGSDTGKRFLEGRDEIKSQFLGHCLKSHHKKKTQESEAPPYQRSHPSHPGVRPIGGDPQAHPPPRKKLKAHPVSMTRVQLKRPTPSDTCGGASNISSPIPPSRPMSSTPIIRKTRPTSDTSAPDITTVKQEGNDDTDNDSFDPNTSLEPNTSAYDPNTSVFSAGVFSSSVHSSHTQVSSDSEPGQPIQTDTSEDTLGSSLIKVEPVTESELDIEITGVDMGDGDKMPAENWGAAGAEGDGFQGGDQSEYKGPPALICSVCGKLMKTQNSLRHHENIHLGKSPFSCCGKRFTSTTHLRRHMCHNHNVAKTFVCPDDDCEKSFATQADLNRHQRRKRVQWKYRCDVCGKRFETICNQRDHADSHEGGRSHSCRVCYKTFTFQSSLSRHMKTHGM